MMATNELLAENQALKERIKKLEGWIQKTGHWQYCDFIEGTPYTCKCGLDNLLRGK